MTHYRYLAGALCLCMIGSLGCLIMQDNEGYQEEYDEFEENNLDDDERNDDQRDEREDEPKDEPKDDPTVDAFIIKGKLTLARGQEPVTSGNTLVLWTVNSESGDYLYAYGRGTIERNTFTAAFSNNAPPAEALNNDTLGVAMILALPEDVELPADGKIDRSTFRDLSAKAIGITRDHGVIYRNGDNAVEWSSAFDEDAYTCGQGAEQSNSNFDAFNPVSCADVTLHITTSLEWVNWT